MLTASTSAAMAGTGQVVICAGKEINRKMRPAMAGLNILFPNPPKDSFTTPIANKHPNARIHNGRFEGTLNASSTPVMMADPSKIAGSFFRMYFTMRYSNAMQKNTEEAVSTSASIRKTYKATKKAGIRAISTPYIFFSIVSPLCTCGDGETTSLCSISFFLFVLVFPGSNDSVHLVFTQPNIIQ